MLEEDEERALENSAAFDQWMQQVSGQEDEEAARPSQSAEPSKAACRAPWQVARTFRDSTLVCPS